MGLKLLRIELVNIRSHKHIVFEPELEGITAIQGANGMGKSSIVDSTAWCLYGTKPNGVSKANEIFKTGIGEKDPAWAKVDLEVDGKPMRFERRRVNKHGGIEVEVFQIEKNTDGTEKLTNVAGPSITHAESYIRKLLRMDEKGFLAAVLIQQKQVDQLISASPRERGQVIEKLTGIAGVTAALTEAKQDFNALKKAASFSTIDPHTLEKLKSEEHSVTESAKELKSKLQVLKEKAVELKRNGEGVKIELETASALFERKNKLENDLNAYTLKKTLKEEDLTSVMEEKDKAKQQLNIGSGQSVETLNGLIRDKETESKKVSLVQGRAEDKKEALEQGLIERRALLEETADLNDDLNEVTENIETVKTELKERKNFLIQSASEKKTLEQAIGIIEHGDSCPTCLQTVANPSVATKALLDSVASLDARVDETRTDIASLEEKLSEAAGVRDKLIAKDEAVTWIAKAEKALKDTKKELDGAAGSLRLVEKELKVLRGKLDEARQEEQKKQAHQRLLERAQRLTGELEDIDFQISKIKKESSELGASSQREINSLQKRLDEIRGKHSSASMDYTSKTGELKLQVQKIEHLRKDIARHEEDIRKHNELVQSVAVAAHTHELIGEFREERIRNSIPVIEVYASDLLSRFTEGKFTRLSLNQKFEATVYLADGTPRAVGLLSGGELSAAAMALRLAISLLLNSGADQNLMILDEVLVSQDANRAEQILTTLKEVARGQVILIAHNESIDSVADKIVTLNGRSSSGETETTES